MIRTRFNNILNKINAVSGTLCSGILFSLVLFLGVLQETKAADCAFTWDSTQVSNSEEGLSVTYSLYATIPGGGGGLGNCGLPLGNLVTIDFPAGTDASGVTSGTLNGNAITFSTQTATQITFNAPVSVAKITQMIVVLNGIVNPTPATYTTLTSTYTNNSGGTNTINTSNYSITPTTSPPNAAFTQSATSVCEGNSITFTDNSTLSPTSWEWTFSNGTPATSTAQNPVVTYNTAGGPYDVQLIAINANGRDTITQTDLITVQSAPSIVTDPIWARACVGADTSFTVVAAGPGLTYQWQENDGGGFVDISDGGFYSNTNSATLNLTGVTAALDGYRYRCVVSGTCSPSVTSNSALFNILNDPTTVVASPTIVNYDIPISDFINVSASGTCRSSDYIQPAGSIWGITWTSIKSAAPVSATVSIMHNSHNNIYAAALPYSTTFNGFADVTYNLAINNSCTPTVNSVSITNIGNYNSLGANTFLINFDFAGSSSQALVDQNPAWGTGYYARVSVDYGPGSLTASSNTVCAGDTTSFLVTATGDTVIYQWQVDEGSGYTDLTNDATYSDVDQPELQINGADTAMSGFLYRCIVSGFCNSADTSSGDTLFVNPQPIAGFTMDTSNICLTDTIQFTDTSSASVTQWEWTFEGGTPGTSMDQHPKVAYDTDLSSPFDVTLEVSDGTCSSSITMSDAVSVNAPPTIGGATTTVTYDIPSTNLINMESLAIDGDYCFTPSEYKQITSGSEWGIFWTSTGTQTPLSVQVRFNYVIEEGDGPYPTTLNGTSDNTINPFVVSCGFSFQTFSFTPANYNVGGVNVLMVDYSGLRNHYLGFDGFGYAQVIVEYPAEALIADTSICEGNSAMFSLEATGSGISYQWQEDNGGGFSDISDGGVYAGATTDSLVLSAVPISMNGYQYRCIVSGFCSPDDTSSTGTLTVTANSGSATWTGAIDDNWFEGSNWSSGCPPSCATDVIIPDISPNPFPNIRFSDGGTATAKSIDVQSGATLNFGDVDAELQLCGDFTNSGTVDMTDGSSNGEGTILFGSSTASQNFLNNTGATANLNNVVINNTSGSPMVYIDATGQDMILGSDGILTLTSGLLTPGAGRSVIVNNSRPNAITGHSTASYVNTENSSSGEGLNRAISDGRTTGNNFFDFPVGNSSSYQLINLDFAKSSLTGLNDITVHFWNETGFGTGLPLTDISLSWNALLNNGAQPALNGGIWTMTLDAGTCSDYNITLYGRDYDNEGALHSVVKRTSTGNAWGWDGSSYVAGSVGGGVVMASRTGFSGFSDVAIVSTPTSVVPMEFESLEAKNIEDKKVLVTWDRNRIEERDIKEYQIQRSAEGVYWSILTSAELLSPSNPDKKYAITDEFPLEGESYYRLKRIHTNGDVSYSKARVIHLHNSHLVSVYPNPARNTLFINCPDHSEIQLINSIGKVVQNVSQPTQNDHRFTLDVSNLPVGVYYLKVQNSQILTTLPVLIGK